MPTIFPQYASAPVAAGQTASAAVDLRGLLVYGLMIPAGFTGTTVTFQAAETLGGTYVPVRDGAGNSVGVTVAASQFVRVDPILLMGVRFIKVVCGSAQAADAVPKLAVRGD